MKAADVGISVDTAVDIAKESSDIILTEKDLAVLENGIREGRKTYANTTKYIKLTTSSNFGNMLSILVASVFLPFLPMLPLQILVLNLIYDISCLALPFDNVDEDYLKKPRRWEAVSISRFMAIFDEVYKVFGLSYKIVLSTRPEKDYIGTVEYWDKSEAILAQACKDSGHEYTINPGDGAFYGPKLDFKLKDSMAAGRSIYC